MPPIPSRTPSYSLALFFSVVSRIFVAFSSSPPPLPRSLSGEPPRAPSGEPCCPSCGPPPPPPPLPSLWVAAPPLPFLLSGDSPRQGLPRRTDGELEAHASASSPGLLVGDGEEECWSVCTAPRRRGAGDEGSAEQEGAQQLWRGEEWER